MVSHICKIENIKADCSRMQYTIWTRPTCYTDAYRYCNNDNKCAASENIQALLHAPTASLIILATTEAGKLKSSALSAIILTIAHWISHVTTDLHLEVVSEKFVGNTLICTSFYKV